MKWRMKKVLSFLLVHISVLRYECKEFQVDIQTTSLTFLPIMYDFNHECVVNSTESKKNQPAIFLDNDSSSRYYKHCLYKVFRTCISNNEQKVFCVKNFKYFLKIFQFLHYLYNLLHIKPSNLLSSNHIHM